MAPTSRCRTTSCGVSREKWMSSTSARMSRTTRRPDLRAVGQVDLGDVTGDHHLGAEAQPGQEHLHLLGRGVLGLVQDDERVVERAAAHVGQRGDLDGAGCHEPRDRLGVDHVVQRVVERAQVGVDLVVERAGQEAEPLARLDRRPGQDDPVDLLGLQRLRPPWPSRGRSCRCRRGRCRRRRCACRSRRRSASGSASWAGSCGRARRRCSSSARRRGARWSGRAAC